MKVDFWSLSKYLHTQPCKSINFYPKLWYPKARASMVYSIGLFSCMFKYKDASKGQSSGTPLNTLFLDTL